MIQYCHAKPLALMPLSTTGMTHLDPFSGLVPDDPQTTTSLGTLFVRVLERMNFTSPSTMVESASISTPPRAPSDARPRKRVSQACQPCGLKKIKVNRSPRGSFAFAILTSPSSATEVCPSVLPAKSKTSNVHMESPSVGRSILNPMRNRSSRDLSDPG